MPTFFIRLTCWSSWVSVISRPCFSTASRIACFMSIFGVRTIETAKAESRRTRRAGSQRGRTASDRNVLSGANSTVQTDCNGLEGTRSGPSSPVTSALFPASPEFAGMISPRSPAMYGPCLLGDRDVRAGEEAAGRPVVLDDRLAIPGHCRHLAVARRGQVVLDLEDLVGGRQAVVVLLALGVEVLLRQVHRHLRRLELLTRSFETAHRRPHFRRDPQLELLLGILARFERQVGHQLPRPGRTVLDRDAELERHRPAREVAAGDLLEGVVPAARNRRVD